LCEVFALLDCLRYWCRGGDSDRRDRAQ